MNIFSCFFLFLFYLKDDIVVAFLCRSLSVLEALSAKMTFASYVIRTLLGLSTNMLYELGLLYSIQRAFVSSTIFLLLSLFFSLGWASGVVGMKVSFLTLYRLAFSVDRIITGIFLYLCVWISLCLNYKIRIEQKKNIEKNRIVRRCVN